MDLYGGYFGRPTAPGADVNFVTARAINPTARGANLGGVSDAANPMQILPAMATGTGAAAVGPVSTRQMAGKPLAWWTGMLVLVVGIFFAAKKAGKENEFSNIRASSYNVALITFIAILGITLAKVIAVRVAHVPGLAGFASVVIAA